jgi:hypothetical protein
MVSLAGHQAAANLLILSGDANIQVRRAAVQRLAEWSPDDPPTLAALARFALEFPEDELSPAIAVILRKYAFDPGSIPGETVKKYANIPQEILVEVPNLLVLLDRWRLALRQQSEEAAIAEADSEADAETQKVETALSDLIAILAEAKHPS